MTEETMNMSPWQAAAALAAVPMAAAYLCRLAPMSWGTARARYVWLHFLGLCYCGAVIFLQPEGVEILAEAIGLAFCGAYLQVTYPTWRDGPPDHVMTAPGPLDEPAYVPGARDGESRWLQ